MNNRSLAHIRRNCKYHIVFIPKYRKKVRYGKVKADMRDIIRTLCEIQGRLSQEKKMNNDFERYITEYSADRFIRS